MVTRSCLVVLTVLLMIGCDTESSSAPSMSHEGQGEAVVADPQFTIKLAVDSKDMTWTARQFSVFESKPATADKPERPQGFELAGDDGFVLAGRLPADVPFAPSQQFEKLIGVEIAVAQRGGDPSAPSMSKIRTTDGKTYIARSGKLSVTKAFYKKGTYAGVSGTLDVELQELKLGNPDDPNNKGDQLVGQPFKASGTFTAVAASYPYQQL